MKALAASHIGQYERAVVSLHHYQHTVELGLSSCLRHSGTADFNPTTRRARIGVILLGSDQGLVGRFNESLVEFSDGTLSQSPFNERRIWAIGERMYELVVERGLPTSTCLRVPTSVEAISRWVDELLLLVEAARDRREVDAIHLFYNRPLPGARYQPTTSVLLPLDDAWLQHLTALSSPNRALPEVVGDLRVTLQRCIREYLYVILFRACAESLASENASRLTAMQRAEKNIDEIRAELSRRFHRSRQESIDEELFDVISGYDGLAP